MFQRNSLSWQLSELSPVWIAKASGAPLTGPCFALLTARTIASAVCRVSISWDGSSTGAARAWVAAGVLVLEAVDVLDPHGDCASTMCTSVRCANAVTGCAARDRCGAARVRRGRSRTVWCSAAADDDRRVAAGAGRAANERASQRGLWGSGLTFDGPGGRRERQVCQGHRPADDNARLNQFATRQVHGEVTIQCQRSDGYMSLRSHRTATGCRLGQARMMGHRFWL